MAELLEGTYLIVSVASGLAVDVKGGADSSKTNVQQYTPNYTDAQIWAATNYSNGWQFKCSLTNKCMDIAAGSLVSGTNVQQYDDNNSRAQRWAVVPDGGTYTFGGESYDTFNVRPYAAQTLSLDVAGGSQSPGANIRIYTNNTTAAQKWIFVPVSVFSDTGSYRICPAADPSLSIGVAADASANYASVVLQASDDKNSQIVTTSVDPESYIVRFKFGHSGKYMDVRGGSVAKAGTDVIQYQFNNDSSFAQLWLPIKKGSIEYEGEIYHTYEFATAQNNNLVMDVYRGEQDGYKSSTNVQVYTRNNGRNQRFIIVRDEALGKTLAIPGNIDQKEFHRDGPGDIVVQNLTFSSDQTSFKARYKVRKYTKGRESYVDSEWMNFADDSTSRSGWGDAWSSTFEATPVKGKVTIPFQKTVTLDSQYLSADFIVETRVYKDDYHQATNMKAHGPVCSSTVWLGQVPEVSATSTKFEYDPSSQSFGVSIELEDSLATGCSFLRARIVDGDGEYLSDWKTSSNMSVTHMIGGSLYTIPSPDDDIFLEYSMLTNDGLSTSGTIPLTLEYDGTSSPTIEYVDDGSLTVVISDNMMPYEHCFFEIPFFGKTKTVEAEKIQSSGATSSWKCPPPLNKDVKIIKIGSSDGTSWTYSISTVRIDTHLFIWNWADQSSPNPYSECASVIINSDAPPKQTRIYNPATKFNSPAGRIHPVAFGSVNVSTDLSVQGVIIDEGVEYQSAGPMPDSAKMNRIMLLVGLTGEGIHPIYRTPYGDWSQVAIESVDVSKDQMYLSNVSVSQHSVED